MAVASILIVLALVVLIVAIVGVIIAAVMSKKSGGEAPTQDGSYFDGGYFAYIGYSILVGLVTMITLGIAFPWMCCLMQRWQAKHTVVCGKRQYFDGTGVQLIGKFILWSFLTIITFGIYGFWMAIAIKKWITKHTHFVGEKDDNSYFDGGVLGFIGTNILAGIVSIIPFVGLAWSNVIVLRWEKKHTVIDSRRLVFEGTVGTFFVKYLIWILLTAVTFGIFALFIPVKILKLQAENTIDHEHTAKKLMEQSEYRNKVLNTVSANKNATTEFEMEGLKAGINDTTDEAALRALAEGGSRSAQYIYVTRFANGQYSQEPFCSMLKASADAGYAPAMCLYALNCELDANYKNELLTKAAEQGQLAAIRERMNLYATSEVTEEIEKAVFYADLLENSGEQLTEQEFESKELCVMKLRKIESAKSVASKMGAGIIAIVAVAFIAIIAVVMAVLAMLFGITSAVKRPAMENAYMDGAYDSGYNEIAAPTPNYM